MIIAKMTMMIFIIKETTKMIEEDYEDEDEEEDREYYYEESPRCGCPYCHCMNDTIAGEICSMCDEGAHQG